MQEIMDDLDNLKEIGDMPQFAPRDTRPPGVERVALDSRTQSVVDAFSVQEQQNQWVARALSTINGNMVTLMNGLRHTLIFAQESRAIAQKAADEAKTVAQAAIERLDALENKPYKMLWKLMSGVILLLAGGAATAICERLLLKH